MRMTPTITFRGIEASPALETDIRRRLRRLETYHSGIIGCRVLVEFAQRHHARGNRFHVRIDLTVPGEEIAVTHDTSSRDLETGPERKHAHVAVREAFEAARRRLQDYARRQRGSTKRSARPARGRIARLSSVDEHGYIEADDGHEVYFQRTSVLRDAFDRLGVDSRVTFVEEPGDKGPQASTVRLLHPRRARRRSSRARAAATR